MLGAMSTPHPALVGYSDALELELAPDDELERMSAGEGTR